MLSSASDYFSPRGMDAECPHLPSLRLRRARLDHPNGNAAEKIRDVEDNVPPRNGCWTVVEHGLNCTSRPDERAASPSMGGMLSSASHYFSRRAVKVHGEALPCLRSPGVALDSPARTT